MSYLRRTINQKYYIILGITFTLICLILAFMPYLDRTIWDPYFDIPFAGAVIALFPLCIALSKLLRKTFSTDEFPFIIKLLSVASITIVFCLIMFISRIGHITAFMSVPVTLCLVVLGYTYTINTKREDKERLDMYIQISSEKRHLSQKRIIILGIVMALTFLTLAFISHLSYTFFLIVFTDLVGVILAVFLLIIALVIIAGKTFAIIDYNTIIILLIGVILAISLNLAIFYFNSFMILTLVVCVIVIGYSFAVKEKDKQRLELYLRMSIEERNEFIRNEIIEQERVHAEKTRSYILETKKTWIGKYYGLLLRRKTLIWLLIIGACLGCIISITVISRICSGSIGCWNYNWWYITLSTLVFGPFGLVIVALILPVIPYVVYIILYFIFQ